MHAQGIDEGWWRPGSCGLTQLTAPHPVLLRSINLRTYSSRSNGAAVRHHGDTQDPFVVDGVEPVAGTFRPIGRDGRPRAHGGVVCYASENSGDPKVFTIQAAG